MSRDTRLKPAAGWFRDGVARGVRAVRSPGRSGRRRPARTRPVRAREQKARPREGAGPRSGFSSRGTRDRRAPGRWPPTIRHRVAAGGVPRRPARRQAGSVERGEAGGGADQRVRSHRGDGRGQVKAIHHRAEKGAVSERRRGFGEHARAGGVHPAADADRDPVSKHDHVAALERRGVVDAHDLSVHRQVSQGRLQNGLDLETAGRDGGPGHHDDRPSIGEGRGERDEHVRNERGVGQIRLLGKSEQRQSGVLERRAERGVLRSRP